MTNPEEGNPLPKESHDTEPKQKEGKKVAINGKELAELACRVLLNSITYTRDNYIDAYYYVNGQ